MSHIKLNEKSFISPLTGKIITVPDKKKNETYTDTMYRVGLEKTYLAITTGVVSFNDSVGFRDGKISMDF